MDMPVVSVAIVNSLKNSASLSSLVIFITPIRPTCEVQSVSHHPQPVPGDQGQALPISDEHVSIFVGTLVFFVEVVLVMGEAA